MRRRTALALAALLTAGAAAVPRHEAAHGFWTQRHAIRRVFEVIEAPDQHVLIHAPVAIAQATAAVLAERAISRELRRRDLVPIATVIMLVNLLVDLLYGLINPRIRHAR